MDILKELRPERYPNRPDHSQKEAHQIEKPILEISKLSLLYETGFGLEDITFALQVGERVAVVGPNGAGKSTLFKIIAGVLNPTHGEVKIFGNVPDGHICIAYMPQRNHVDWNFPVTLSEVVMMGRVGRLGLLRWPSRRDWDYVQKALRVVGLEELAGRQIGQLSGGQQQRMFIARALAQEAELMLMDEPLNGLDIASQEMIFSILDELRNGGVTVMVATHDLDQAAERFDRVMLLNRRLLGFGSPTEVFTTQNLGRAYGGHLHLLNNDPDLLALTDTCCEE